MRNVMLGKFIVIEGIEGAGKTTAINIIADELAKHGISQIEYTREPGGTIIAEEIRSLIKQQYNSEKLTENAELLLMYAARAQLVETVIKPALDQGKWVIGDRHDLSSQAYQGGGRGIALTLISQLKQLILGDFQPDLTFYMDVTPEVGLQRAKQRGELDRFESESLLFFKKIRACYQVLIKNNNKIRVIDATQPLNEVERSIRNVLRLWLQEQKVK